MADQQRALNDDELRSLFNSDADLSLLTSDEQQRLLKLTDQSPTGLDESGRPRTVGSVGQATGMRAPQGAEWLEVFKDDPLIQGARQGMALPLGGQATVLAEPFRQIGNFLTRRAVPAIRSALKPTVSQIKQSAGVSQSGINAEANRLARLVRDTGFTTPEAAEAKIKGFEKQVQDISARVGPDADDVTRLTDAPQRAVRMLTSLRRRASNQMSPADDVATVGNELEQFKKTSPLFTSRSTIARTPSGAVIPKASSGSPNRNVTELETVTERVPRANVTVSEALGRARGTSRHQTNKQFGEQKSMSVEAQKALDRAGRSAAKTAAPELKAPLRGESDMIRLKKVLERMQFREGNRDQLSLPGVVAAAPAIANNQIPFLGLVTQWLRDNQMKAGLMANKFGPRITRNAQRTAEELQQILLAATLNGMLRGEDRSPTAPPE